MMKGVSCYLGRPLGFASIVEDLIKAICETKSWSYEFISLEWPYVRLEYFSYGCDFWIDFIFLYSL